MEDAESDEDDDESLGVPDLQARVDRVPVAAEWVVKATQSAFDVIDGTTPSKRRQQDFLEGLLAGQFVEDQLARGPTPRSNRSHLLKQIPLSSIEMLR